jgi:plastocyanin
MQRRWLGAALIGIIALLPACGGGGGSGSSAPCAPAEDTRAAVGGRITICAFDIHFDVKNITSTAGPLEVTLINKGSIAHTFDIPDKNFELATPKKNDTKTGTVTLEKGTYTFRCTISGHEAAGMKGKITVS